MKSAQVLNKTEIKNIHIDDIRKFRDERCYTQEFMADRLGITQSAYYKLEAGIVKISFERLEQISKILNKPLDAFLEKENQKEQYLNDNKVVINVSEFDLLQKTIYQQEKRIEELEGKIARKDKKIDELKRLLINNK